MSTLTARRLSRRNGQPLKEAGWCHRNAMRFLMFAMRTWLAPAISRSRVGYEALLHLIGRDRPSLRSLQQRVRSIESEMDGPENDRTRLPESEEIHLGGLVIAEVFPPSSASALRDAVEGFPIAREKKTELIAWLSKGRSSSGVSGRMNLAIVRHGCPKDVHVVNIDLYFLQPSFTVLIATFGIADDGGDLSKVLRSDYASDGHVSVIGPLGWARSRIPWSRPADSLVAVPNWRPSRRKRQAFEDLIREHEVSCWGWLADRFPGRFCREDPALRPSFRVLTTKESNPYVDDHRWLNPPDLRFRSDLWRPTTSKNWFLQVSDWPRDLQTTATAATRRLPREANSGQDVGLCSPQQMALQFASGHSPVVARWATSCLLSLYADELAALRDHAGRRPQRWLPRQHVRAALDLDRYLIGDGLDAATVASDVARFAEDPQNFATDLRAYPEYLESFPESARAASPPREMMAWIQEGLQERAERLERDTSAATGNIRASAELRQAIANTRLQRVVVPIALLTLVAAVITLIITLRASRLPAEAATAPDRGTGQIRVAGPAVVPRAPPPRIGSSRCHSSSVGSCRFRRSSTRPDLHQPRTKIYGTRPSRAGSR